MESTGFGLVSLVTFLPLIGALLLMLVPDAFPKVAKYGAFGITLLTFGLSVVLYLQFQGGSYHFQLVESMPWIKSLGISYKVGIDGISVWLILLTTFLMIIGVWFSFYVDKRVKTYMVMMLILETAMLGVFVSLDMILFYTFFEASLIPMYFLINIWGGERRSYAAIKFFLYTFSGSIFMLIGMIAMALLHREATGTLTFDLIAIQDSVASGNFWKNALQLQPLLFWAFAIAFMVKCPMFPFHTWLPDAHVEAPTAGSIILAGVLLKMGTYGFLRFCLPLFPDTIRNQVPIIVGLAVIGIIYGALVAAVQPDVKKLVAYSSVAHMGFVMLGIFSLTHSGLMGGAFQQLNHGISTGALFLLIGLIYERRHTRLFKDFGGLKAQMPIYATLFLIIMLSSVGLPGTNGFIGEFLALLGSFEAAYAGAFGLHWIFPAVAGVGVILAAVYLLVMFMKMFYGPNTNPDNLRLRDLKTWEVVMTGLLVVFVFWGGLYPNTFLKPMEASIGAVRMMALNPVGERPSYQNLEMEIDAKGNLVQVTERRRNGDLETFEVVREISPANLHFPLRDGEPAEARADGPRTASRLPR
ncbi:MAG TPA: NADH-quinone oxidoreductase subunit M [Fimbriimonadaceae bacterium]|nr:NADH-quinone oxidoreductase subunit M [Fimbriimonadaceae bacterium]